MLQEFEKSMGSSVSKSGHKSIWSDVYGSVTLGPIFGLGIPILLSHK